MSMSLWELAATPLSIGQMVAGISGTCLSRGIVQTESSRKFEAWLKAELKKRNLAEPKFLVDYANGEYLNAAIQTLYETWRTEHASG
ncbi:hypothetical protein [Pseudomonas juntendi]|uniref:hypothetical protein n=1 Tax=Pseudomonas juntendi TaxID=2666183 RepID=UPI001B8268B6|nr:hypothetical protein [Pseudomonas juntendi]MBR7523931.1 hypothetical protein [Pseudomonas juntendi]